MQQVHIYLRAAIGAAAGGALATVDHLTDNPAEILANPKHILLRAAVGAAMGVLMMLAKGHGLKASIEALRAGKTEG